MALARIIQLSHRRRRTGTTIRALPGLVVISAPGHPDQTYTADQADAVAHALATVAATARDMQRDAEGRKRG